MSDLIDEFDRLIRRDPARRGLIGSESHYGPLCAGHLKGAATDLAERGKCVVIVTGFYVPHADPPAAETDGPLGSVVLASALQKTGSEVFLLTDERCFPALLTAAEAAGIAPERVLCCPDCTTPWIDSFFNDGRGSELTHLIAVERVGPSHTPDSLIRQSRCGKPPVAEFTASVSAESHNRCHNMRGRVIDEYSASLHRLFERLPQYRPDVTTIGIGDGANEIGMGVIPWEDLVRRLEGDCSGRIPCRIATDWNIVAGTSNWGAYALAAATLALRGEADVLQHWDQSHEERILQYLVEKGPAVDGVTGRQEPTVDGMPFITYIQPWVGIRQLLGYDV